MPKALLMVENGFEDAEVLYPYYRMQEAGYQVDLVGPVKGGTYKGKHGYPITAELGPEDVVLADYEAVIVPGGQAPDKLRLNEQLVGLVKAADEQGLVVAAICHGPQVLIEADILRGRNVTCYRSVLTDVLNAGAIYHDVPVAVDRRLVTSRTPRDLPDFCRQILTCLLQCPGGENSGDC